MIHAMRGMTTKASRFLAWPRSERWAGALAIGLLILARVGIRFGGIPSTRQALSALLPRIDIEACRLSQIVASAANALPGATPCLPRALVLEALLRSDGRAAELRIGLAAREGKPRPKAHAWVDLGGVAVAEDVSRYTAMPLFGARW